MSSSQQRRAQGHEVCDAVVAIADQFVEYTGYQCQRFGMVQSYASRESLLGEEASLGDNEFIDLI